uniref:Uncharacterized protein n=1 Tax=Bos indicus x Bos taurus TaxID=30522 RepID=A0A4W2H167_BOBOX
MFRLLLMSMFTVLFVNERFRLCHSCDYFNGLQCLKPKKDCWKLNILITNRIVTEGLTFFLFSLGRQLYHYSVLSCKDGEGVQLLHHDLLRERYCCINDDRCNGGGNLPEKSKFGLEGRESIYDLEPVVYK